MQTHQECFLAFWWRRRASHQKRQRNSRCVQSPDMQICPEVVQVDAVADVQAAPAQRIESRVTECNLERTNDSAWFTNSHGHICSILDKRQRSKIITMAFEVPWSETRTELTETVCHVLWNSAWFLLPIQFHRRTSFGCLYGFLWFDGSTHPSLTQA